MVEMIWNGHTVCCPCKGCFLLMCNSVKGESERVSSQHTEVDSVTTKDFAHIIIQTMGRMISEHKLVSYSLRTCNIV